MFFITGMEPDGIFFPPELTNPSILVVYDRLYHTANRCNSLQTQCSPAEDLQSQDSQEGSNLHDIFPFEGEANKNYFNPMPQKRR